jgi:hypothetical protein
MGCLMDNLEKRVEDLEKRVEILEMFKRILDPPIPYPTRYPGYPGQPASMCPKCGLKLEGVMGYCCPHIDCPVGMGPVWF